MTCLKTRCSARQAIVSRVTANMVRTVWRPVCNRKRLERGVNAFGSRLTFSPSPNPSAGKSSSPQVWPPTTGFRRSSGKKSDYMKLSMTSKNFLAVLALLLTTGAFAASKGSFNVYERVTVSGHQLAPGEYQLKWDGTGPSVELSILSQGKVVATVPARLIEMSRADYSATHLDKNDDGTQSLTEIDFARKKYALAFCD